MSSKAALKKKDAAKNSYSFKSDDDEVKAELEALSGLEYNLHGEKENEAMDSFPLSVRKSRMQTTKESNKGNDKITMESDKLPLIKEKVDAESSIPYLSSSVSKKELRNVIEQAGNTSEDRYKILEARDRLMRLRRRKIHTLETAKATVGTCPDMCPEKERLMREFQRQAASYELLDCSEYRINHEIAVKQYSRSSADQEEPMPQDLRPVSSLKMTMSYLLHEIVDLCEEEGTNLAEWYHFLWDRTRGIRKDITQQELCCVDTVELVENCARFHIVCSERLCAEELSVFDKKINTENLTKCLQTLKYMYHDLRVKGVNCKNEPEFRAYIILLNLNDANFMWDLQRLPSSIQKSPEVSFAVRVYSAIQSNNYTKFFKLLRSTTYLNACILLRYFFQVRAQALSIMVKAYCRTTSTAYPLYEFMDILAFEDENEAVYFCERAGLNLSDDEMHIILNRQNIVSPSSTSEQGRSKNIVEAKRVAMAYSIGQAIAGGRMPEQFYINHKPHNSFDSNGYLKSEAINANDQSGNNDDIIEIDDELEEQDEYMDEDMPDETPPPPYVPTDTRLKKSSTIPNVSVKNKTKKSTDESSIFPTTIFPKHTMLDASAIGDSVKFPFASPLDTPKITELLTARGEKDEIKPEAHDKKSATSDAPRNDRPILFGELMTQSNNIFASSKTPSASENVFKFSSQTNHNSGVPQPNIFSQSINSVFSRPKHVPFGESRDDCDNSYTPKAEIVESVAPMKELAVESTNKEKADKIQRAIEKSTAQAAEELENEVIHDVCSTILKQEIRKDAVCDRHCNEIFSNLLEQVVLENCQSILEDEILTQRRMQDISNRMKRKIIMKYYRIWCQRVFIKKQQRKALDHTPVWLPRCSLAECANNLYNKEQNLVIQNMRCRRKIDNDHDNDQRDFLVPVEVQIYNGIKQNARTSNVELSSIMYWKMIISWPDLNQRFLLKRYKKIMCEYFCPHDSAMDPIIKTYKPNPHEKLNICIKQLNEVIDENQTTGADGLFFIATIDENAKSVANRLTTTILSRQRLMHLPLVVVIIGNEIHRNRLKLTNEIQKLVNAGYISKYVMYYEAHIDESIILKLTQTAIDWLVRHKPSTIPLEMNSLSELISSCLTDELWLRISGHASFNISLSTGLRYPHFVIDIHNEAVAHLLDIIHDPESLSYTSFPFEFKQFLPKEFTLPCTYEYFDEDWKTAENRRRVERILRSFTLPPWPFDWPIEDTMELQKCIVQYCEGTLTNSNYSRISCNILSHVFYMSDEKETPNFVHVILEISKERLRYIDENVRVVYNKNHIKHFQTLPWWFESDTLINFNVENEAILEVQQFHDQVNEEPAEKKRRIAKDKEELPHIIDKYENYSDENDPGNSLMEQSHFDDIFNISQQFERTLSKQLLSNCDFEKKLESALREVDMNI